MDDCDLTDLLENADALDSAVSRITDLGFSDNRFGCGSGILCERTNGTQYGQGSRRNQKKFFHSCVG